MKRDLTLANILRSSRSLHLDMPPFIGPFKLQHFTVVIQNNAGTLQHAFVQNPLATSTSPFPMLVDRIQNIAPLGAFTNTPTLGAGQGFTAGAGINAHQLFLDTVPIDVSSLRPQDFCGLTFYDGNNTRVNATDGFASQNVLGDTRRRFCLAIYNAATGASVNINTTWLPSGKQAHFTYLGYL